MRQGALVVGNPRLPGVNLRLQINNQAFVIGLGDGLGLLFLLPVIHLEM